MACRSLDFLEFSFFLIKIILPNGSYPKKNIKKWMKPSKREVSPKILSFLGAKLRVEYQPLGTVGLISPWNFPVVLTFGPLGSIFAAGNRVMIKPSEFTPITSELMKQMFKENF